MPYFSESFSITPDNATTNEQRIQQLETDVASLKSKNNELCNIFALQPDCNLPTTVQIIVSIIAGVIPSTVIPIILWYYNKQSDKRSRPLLLDSANNVFRLISGSENKKVWTLMSELREEYKITNEFRIFHNSPHEKQIYQFKENLNKLGALYLADVIDEKFLFNTYGVKIIQFYCILKKDIEEVRIRKKNDEHCLLFECMHHASANYLKYNEDPRYVDIHKEFKDFPYEISPYIYKKIPKEYQKKLLINLKTKSKRFNLKKNR